MHRRGPLTNSFSGWACCLGLCLVVSCAPSALRRASAARPPASTRGDHSAYARPAPPEPAPVYAESKRSIVLTYLGVAGWSVSDGDATMLFDPYVTRAPIEDWDAVVEPDLHAIARLTPEHADLIAVSHSHVDHVLDVPSIAWRTGAVVVGTETTARLARAAGLPERDVMSVRGGEDIHVGAFYVRVVPARHSLIKMQESPLSATLRLPLRASDYPEGGTLQYFVRLAGHSIYFVGTANFIEPELHDMRPDVAIVAVGMRDKVHDYTCRLLRALGLPPFVLANHFDNWRQPWSDGTRLVAADAEADLAAFEAEVHACAPNTRVDVPVHLQPIRL